MFEDKYVVTFKIFYLNQSIYQPTSQPTSVFQTNQLSEKYNQLAN